MHGKINIEGFMWDWILKTIKTIASTSWEKSKSIHRKALKKSGNLARLIIGTGLYLLISYSLLTDDIGFGLSFIFSGGIAIFFGYVYKGEKVMLAVLLGVGIGRAIIPSIFPGIKDSFISGDLISIIILILFGIFLWYYSTMLKKGDIPEMEPEPTKKPIIRRKNKTARKRIAK
jgi:hypothetical protein